MLNAIMYQMWKNQDQPSLWEEIATSKSSWADDQVEIKAYLDLHPNLLRAFFLFVFKLKF